LRQEVSSAVVRAFRNARLNRPDAEHALASAAQMLSSAAIELVPSERVQLRAETIALDLRHSLLDCLYIALAERESCDLVTTDATLISRAAPHFPFVKRL
jgi:predicted nucleic acid-binding protein